MYRMIRIVFLSLLAFALSVPLMATAQASQPQLATNPSGPTPRQRGGGAYDAQIQQDVTAELRKHDWAKDVRSSVEDSIVTLEGTVPLYIDKVRAYDKMHNKSHVQGVRNLIVVSGANVPDDQLRDKLAEKLRYDRLGYGQVFNDFRIGVNNGVVTLEGEAHNPADAASALAIVEDTPGVKDVIDEVKVLPTSGFDDQTRLAVARAIYGNPALQKYAIDPQRPIRIIIDNGHVTLWGVVDSQLDKQIADQAARSVPNVFSVKDNLVVAGQQPATAAK